MATVFVLCRRELQDFGELKKFCSKPISRANDLDWCDECRSRLPFWPLDRCEFCSTPAAITVKGAVSKKQYRVCSTHVNDSRLEAASV